MEEMESFDELSASLTKSHQSMLDTLQQIQAKIDLLKEKEQKWEEAQKKIKENVDKASQIVKFNVCGRIFVTSKSTLTKWPDTYFEGLLGSGNWKPDEDGKFLFGHYSYFQAVSLLIETPNTLIAYWII
jgi:FtsZ-binding cell division protein ZapB